MPIESVPLMAPIEGLSGWSGRRFVEGPPGLDGTRVGCGLIEVPWHDHVCSVVAHVLSDPTRERLGSAGAFYKDVTYLLGELGPDVLREGSEQVAGPRDVGVDVGEAVGGLPGVQRRRRRTSGPRRSTAG